MPAHYLDFGLFKGDYGIANEYKDVDAVIIAIRNLLFAKPGNYPFHPSLGINIKKYQFDILDDETIGIIESELQDAINEHIPSQSGIDCYVRRVLDDETGKTYLGIAIKMLDENGERVEANFLLDQNDSTVKVFNEIR